jgi:hypothetical protein
MHRLAVGAEQESATPNTDKELRSIKNGGGGGHHIIRENFLLGGLLTPTRTPTSSPVLSDLHGSCRVEAPPFALPCKINLSAW